MPPKRNARIACSAAVAIRGLLGELGTTGDSSDSCVARLETERELFELTAGSRWPSFEYLRHNDWRFRRIRTTRFCVRKVMDWCRVGAALLERLPYRGRALANAFLGHQFACQRGED